MEAAAAVPNAAAVPAAAAVAAVAAGAGGIVAGTKRRHRNAIGHGMNGFFFRERVVEFQLCFNLQGKRLKSGGVASAVKGVAASLARPPVTPSPPLQGCSTGDNSGKCKNVEIDK